jgi:Ca2+-binding EF-hand superfamily protein
MTISSLSNSYSNYTQSTSTADRATQLLSDMDSDKDGKVSESEFSAFGQLMSAQGPMGPPPPQSASVSSSTTSSVSTTQGATSSQSVFATIDANADGSLSLDELTSMVAQADTQAAGMHGSRQTQNADSTSSGGTTSSSSSTNATDTLSSLFSSADTNGDGSLSLDEFASMLSQADKQAAGAHRPPPPPPPNATASTSGSNGTSSSDGTSSSSTTSSSSSTNATDTLSSLFSSADTNGDNVLNVDELSALIAQLQANLKTNTQ